MTEYKLICSDVDGTLLDSTLNIMPRTKRIIRKIVDMGIPFVISSARMPESIRSIMEKIGVRSPSICYCGALVLDEHGMPLGETPIDAAVAAVCCKMITRDFPHINCSLYSDDKWLASHMSPQVEHTIKVTGILPEFVRFSELDPSTKIHKMMCRGTQEQITELETALKGQFPQLNICQSHTTCLEIMSSRASKAGGIEILCRHYGITPAEVIAIGDNFNDAEMLSYAGMGIAMGNAPAEIKRIANQVTTGNDEEGIYMALRELIAV
ncbi:Cof-type HAD-IIB family hydrolase [Anaerolentibacter hominis]|uniref:Cof-type HAD-IIB family hydrolase n=1 Tax=Anaerolentibacter hominis TaxID=3079009 RepID=UPI0031B7FF88